MTQEIGQVFKNSLIFSGLGEEELGELAALAARRRLAPEEFVFWEGDAPDFFYLVLRGRVKVVKQSPTGKEFIVSFFGPGEMFGEVAVFENKPYPASSVAAEETVVASIRRTAFLAFLAAHPEIALKIISVLGGRLREAQARLGDLAASRVQQRIARVLLMLAARMGKDLPFTRREIADMTGTTIETAIRVLSRLGQGKIIRSARGHIIITDEQKLRLLAEGPPRV
ncbi:MAG: Crp/Fnr family transcriptional regulator [Dehalococcoidia bacterium]|nr:MAG: Crp/Fnr family transcriptional regulator [Dehalococcoidia bacterium]